MVTVKPKQKSKQRTARIQISQEKLDIPRLLNPWARKGIIPWAQRQFPYLRNEFQHLADSVWNVAEDELFAGDYKPAADVVELDQCFLIKVDLPGFNSDEIDILATENTLTIRGERQPVCCDKDDKSGFFFHRNERRCGGFSRTFTLPSNISEEVSANCDNGVLTIELAKSEPENTRKVKINA